MPYPSSGFTPHTVQEYVRRGIRNQSEMARQEGISKQAAHKHHARAEESGLIQRTPRDEARRHFPWVVPKEFDGASPVRRLRDHFEFWATQGHGMSVDKRKRLSSWYDFMEENDVVLEFDPNLPPEPGVSSKGGFAYRDRQPGDLDYLIRVNTHTKELSEQARLWLRMPPHRPVV